MSDRELVARIARSPGKTAGYKQLVRELGLGGGRERRLLLEQLARLTVRGQLVKLDRDQWSIPHSPSPGKDLVAGRLDLHRDGYGFVRPAPSTPRRSTAPTEDIFVSPTEINGAMQGDQVLVELEPPRPDGRRSGRIRRILQRGNPTVVGTLHSTRQAANWPSERTRPRGAPGEDGWFVVPFDERMSQHIVIPSGLQMPPASRESTPHRVLGSEVAASVPKGESLEGLVVDVEITSWPTITRPPSGRVIEILGSPDDFGVDVEMMIRKHQLPRLFPEGVLAEARSVAHLDANEVAHRADFRALPIVTIDGETARDFDDAVLVRETVNGYELQVHIADVSHYVRPSSLLDLEARLRGTSVYFPDRAIPMLPIELSSNICSLRPGEDRLVLSCIMQLDAEGRIHSYEITEGVIRSAARMTYTAVSAILDGQPDDSAESAEARERFLLMHRLAVLMNRQREERGSIDFDLPEPVIEFDKNGQMQGITRAERTWANRLIEEFMLAANTCVATWLEDMGVPSLYRIHQKPEPRRVVEFEELAAGFGYSLGLGPLPVRRIVTHGDRRDAARSGRQARAHEIPEDIAVTPRMYQQLAARIEGKPEERILSYLMLRSLRQARYSEIDEGHFALAAPTYTHFTSPIRRYPDLIVHRIAKALLKTGVPGSGQVASTRLASPWTHPNEGRTGPSPANPARRPSSFPASDAPIPESDLSQIAEECSQNERRAADAERELVEWKKVRFMEDKVGDDFSALVLNPTKFGLFVELTDLFVEGLVPIDSLRGDHYTFRENTHEIVGSRFGRVFRAGDRVQVILDRILAQERKLQFSIIEDELPLVGKRALKPPAKHKKPRRLAASPPPRRKKKLPRKQKRR